MKRANLDRMSSPTGREVVRRGVLLAWAVGLFLVAGCSATVDSTDSVTATTTSSDGSTGTTDHRRGTTLPSSSTRVPTTTGSNDAGFRVVDAEELCDVVPTNVIADRVGLDVLGTTPYSGSIGYTDTVTMQTGCTFELSGDNDLSFAVVRWDDRRPFDSAGFAQLRGEQVGAEDDPFPDDQPFEEVDTLGVPAFFVPTDTRNRLYIDTGVQVLCVAGGTFEITLERPRIVAAATEILDALRTD